MRIGSRFQRSGRSNDRLDRALAAGIGLGFVSFGCFFELPELEPDGGLGGGGFVGVAGDAGEPTPLGGSGGGFGGVPMFPECNNEPNKKLCGDTCVEIGPENGCSNPNSCDACPGLPNAAAPTCGLDTRRCQITSCNADFADCDGDLIAYNNGESSPEGAGRGCEYSFGTIADSSHQLVVPRQQIIVGDDSREDWINIPAYRLERPCVDCVDSVLPFEPNAPNEAPPSTDLTAYFRVAWDANGFYVLAEAFDDRVFNAGGSIDNGGCQTNDQGNYVPGPQCEDAFSVYFDGLQNGENIGSNEVHRVFLGTSGTPFAPAQGQPPSGTVIMQVLPALGPLCYRMEAQFDWKYLVSNQGQPVPGKFPPAENQTYGFDIAVTDWDPSVADADTFESQSQLFWTPREPRSVLHPSIEGIGSIVLVDSSNDPE